MAEAMTAVEKICEFCHSKFVAVGCSAHRKRHRFCSSSCGRRSRDVGKPKYTEKECEYCHSKFQVVANPSKVAARRFCSKGCAGKSKGRDLVERVCAVCKEAFQIHRSVLRARGAKYCSKGCWAIGYSESRRIKRVCEVCGKAFTLKRGDIKKDHPAKYCSQTCMGKARIGISQRGKGWKMSLGSKMKLSRAIREAAARRREGNPSWGNVICASCGKAFHRSPSDVERNQNHFCSFACKQRGYKGDLVPFWRGGVSTLSYPLEFRTVGQKVKIRDGEVCLLCGCNAGAEKGEELCAHHINWDKLDSDQMNLITLCKRCHGWAHRLKTRWVLEQIFIMILRERRWKYPSLFKLVA